MYLREFRLVGFNLLLRSIVAQSEAQHSRTRGGIIATFRNDGDEFVLTILCSLLLLRKIFIEYRKRGSAGKIFSCLLYIFSLFLHLAQSPLTDSLCLYVFIGFFQFRCYLTANANRAKSPNPSMWINVFFNFTFLFLSFLHHKNIKRSVRPRQCRWTSARIGGEENKRLI